ncbi:MAG: hypothetical protein ACT4OE_10825 [Sphingosinicella sp.]
MEMHRRIESYLRRTGMRPARFGRLAMGDPRFVFDLRRGRTIRDATAARIAAWLAAHEEK